MEFAASSTSKSVPIQVVDDSGLPVTGLVAATFPTVKYALEGPNADATITLADLATITTAWASGGVKERGEGYYRLDIPDAVLATVGKVRIRGEDTNKRILCDAIEVTSSSGLGSGARTVTITVDDGADPLEGAAVRLTKGGETYVGLTDVSGVVVFNVDDGTWVVSIVLNGYSYAGSSIVVNGVETATLSMTETSFSVSSPGLTTGYLYCYSTLGVVEESVEVHVRALVMPDDSGIAIDGRYRSATSAADGLVQFANMVKGGTYAVRRGLNGSEREVTIPAGAGATYELLPLVGGQ